MTWLVPLACLACNGTPADGAAASEDGATESVGDSAGDTSADGGSDTGAGDEGEGDDESDEDGSDDGDDGPVVPPCEATHFGSDATLWALPAAGTPLVSESFPTMGGSGQCDPRSTGFNFSTLDLAADGVPDLVITSACDDAGIGTDEWLVYDGGESGFSSDGSPWALPAPPVPLLEEAFARLGGSRLCESMTTGFNYTTRDLDSDGAVDLVVTSACDDAEVGTDHWLVYAGGSGGFASRPMEWTLPAPPPELAIEPFATTNGVTLCSLTQNFRYATLDLTADGVNDLVVTSACDEAGVGTDHWLIYAGGSEGFASEPSLWALPPAPTPLLSEPFVGLSGSFPCTPTPASFSFSTADLTGDGAIDLVVSAACDEASVGTDHWLVYPGGAEGFAAEPVSWTLPASPFGLADETLPTLAGGGLCGPSKTGFNYATTDLTGDGSADLVVTSACDDAEVGIDHWIVYPGGESGFESKPATWGLPAVPTPKAGEAFPSLGGSGRCGSSTFGFNFTTTDLTADGLTDLVVTSACDETGVGTDHWLVYPGQCD